MHFVLWTKVSHESTNFDTFKCFDENLPNSSSHFPNHKSVFLQILHDSSLSWDTLLCNFLVQTLYTLHKRDQSKYNFFLSFMKQNIGFSSNFAPLFSIMRHSSAVLFSWNFIYHQKKEPIKVQIWWNFTWAVQGLKFCTLMTPL